MKRFVFLVVLAALFVSGVSAFARGRVSDNQTYVVSASADNQIQSVAPIQDPIYGGRGRRNYGNIRTNDQPATPADNQTQLVLIYGRGRGYSGR
jgi:hypothetical protein